MHHTVLEVFKIIASIPRPSEDETQISSFLEEFARQVKSLFEESGISLADLTVNKDKAGNILIKVPASSGREDQDTLMLQAHMDMVAVKDASSSHDFATDAIPLIHEGDKLTADRTTLGADNGIGLALALSALALESRPPLEILITSREEVGLLGAQDLDVEGLGIQAKRIINIDSEDIGRISIASAGGARMEAKRDIETVKPKIEKQFKISFSGMGGGHSGVEIDKNRGNLIYEFFAFVEEYKSRGWKIEVAEVFSGSYGIDNAIPSTLDVVVGVKNEDELRALAQSFTHSIQHRFQDAQNMSFDIQPQANLKDVLSDDSFYDVSHFILANKVGVHSMSKQIEGLVQTSNNLGYISLAGKEFLCTYLVRSSSGKELDDEISAIIRNGILAGIDIPTPSKYQGWEEDINGEFLQLVEAIYEGNYGDKIARDVLHAGLEIGAIAGRIKEVRRWDVQAVSLGPTITGAHSTDETLHVNTLEVVTKTVFDVIGVIGNK